MLSMYFALIRRGPWGHLHAIRPEAGEADFVVDDFPALVAALS